jgi:hypothetical protein
MCEWGVNKAPHNTATSVTSKITEVTANLRRATVEKACKCFRLHNEAMVEASGNYSRFILHVTVNKMSILT